MTKGKPSDEIFAMLDELNAEYSVARLSRLGVNLHEAFAIIRALLRHPEPTDPDKIHHIEWIDRMSAIPKDEKGDLLQQDWTRAQMLVTSGSLPPSARLSATSWLLNSSVYLEPRSRRR